MSKAAELAKAGETLTNQPSGRKNIAFNGAMQVAQRATSATGLGANATTFPTVDRFAISAFGTTAGRLTMTQTADGPSGFANCVKLDCTTADTSIAATEGVIFGQTFEGQDLQQLKKGTSDAEKLTVSFYVKGNAAATYTAELRDQDNTRFNSQEFSVTTDWNRITLTYVGDTTGAFGDDNGLSMYLMIWLHAGSNFTGGTHTSNVWHTTGNQRIGDNQTSFFDATSRTFFITGVQMEIGSQATNFEHRSFGEELALCQRYGWNIAAVVNGRVGVGQAVSATLADIVVNHPVTMRAAPTLPSPDASGANVFTGDGSGVASTGIAVQSATPNATRFRVTVSSGLTVGQVSQLSFDATNDAFLDAEL